MRNNVNPAQDVNTRSNNAVDNQNRVFDRNNNTATASVQNSGNSTVNVRVNSTDNEAAGV